MTDTIPSNPNLNERGSPENLRLCNSVPLNSVGKSAMPNTRLNDIDTTSSATSVRDFNIDS